MSEFRPSGPFRSRAYRLLWRCSDWLHRAANGFGYAAAGVLRRDDLRAASRLHWRHYSASRDEVDAGLTPWETDLYTRLLRPSDRVLLVGSGAGRDLLGLRRLGFEVSGLESNLELVELARENLARHGLSACVQAGDIETADLTAPFDAVIFSNFCYSCLHPSATRVTTLLRIASRLPPDGRILLGYGQFKRQSRLSLALLRLFARLASADWRPEPGDAFMPSHLAAGVLSFHHWFLPDEIEHECTAAGLRIIAEEAYTEDHRCVIAQRQRITEDDRAR